MITTYDVRWACDVMRPAYDASSGVDGRVSIEVDPRLAHDTDRTVAEAKQLWWLVDRPNLFIKIPATDAGLPAITETLAAGISVNVTLIFGLDRYDAGHGRLLRRPGAGPGQRARPVHDRLGRLVLRVPGGHRGGQAAGEDRHRRGAGPARQGRHRQRPAGLPALRAGLRQRPLAGAGRGRRAAAAAAVGVDLDQEPGLPRRHVRRGAGRARRGQHHAGGDHPRLRRPRRGQARRGPVARTRRPRRCSTTWPALGIDYDDVIATLEREGVEKFEAALAGAAQERRDPARRTKGERTDERDRGRGRAGRPGRRRRTRRGRGPRRACCEVSAPGLLAEKDPTLWGPDAEAEAQVRLGWVDTFRRSRDLLPELAGAARATWPASTTSCWPAWAARRWRRRSSPVRSASR